MTSFDPFETGPSSESADRQVGGEHERLVETNGTRDRIAEFDWTDPPPWRWKFVTSNRAGTAMRFSDHAFKQLGIGQGSRIAIRYDDQNDALEVWPKPGQGYERVIGLSHLISIGRYLNEAFHIRLMPNEEYKIERKETGNGPFYVIPLHGKTMPA